MNLNEFENNKQEKDRLSDATFAHDDVLSIKSKIEGKKMKQKRLKTILLAMSFVIVLLIVLASYSQYKLYTLSREEVAVTGTQGDTSPETKKTPETPEEVIAALKRHILTPEGTPQIAEVQNVDELKATQAFFKDTQNGDIVIVYESTIFVYRPSQDIVVASGDISGQGQLKP